MTAATEFRAPSRTALAHAGSNLSPRLMADPSRQMESSGSACGADRGGGVRCKMLPAAGFERCGWHRPPGANRPVRVVQPVKRAPKALRYAHTADETDRRLLTPLLGRLIRWAEEFDSITLESGTDHGPVAEWVQWLRVELQPALGLRGRAAR